MENISHALYKAARKKGYCRTSESTYSSATWFYHTHYKIYWIVTDSSTTSNLVNYNFYPFVIRVWYAPNIDKTEFHTNYNNNYASGITWTKVMFVVELKWLVGATVSSTTWYHIIRPRSGESIWMFRLSRNNSRDLEKIQCRLAGCIISLFPILKHTW